MIDLGWTHAGALAAAGGATGLRAHLLDPAPEAVLLEVGIAALLAENIGRTAGASASGQGIQ